VVCGAVEFKGSAESRQTEALYWKYESALRLMEGRLGATLTASGAFYALRRECYRPPSTHTLIEDFVIPMNARNLGYRVLYDPEAVAVDFAADSVAGEFARRVRLAMGSFRALPQLIHARMSGFTFIAFVSHKLLRWMVPFLLIGLLASSLLAASDRFCRLCLIGQLIFYLWGAAGLVFRNRLRRIRYALVAYFVLAMNMAFLVGFVRSLTNRQESTWQRVSG
jgi:cellulose synthase/poly-beta-1,6-N-acetylglucosamine synthase-like glycosyltransferase